MVVLYFFGGTQKDEFVYRPTVLAWIKLQIKAWFYFILKGCWPDWGSFLSLKYLLKH